LKKRILSSPNSRLDYREALEIMYRLVQGVVYVHELGRVHSNLHPESVRFKDTDRSFDCCLADFAFCRLETETLKGNYPHISGAFGFAAPEVMKKGAYGKPADVFSLGVTFYAR